MSETTKAWGLEAVKALRERVAGGGGKVVFTNGCFDVLHVGHARYLAEARALGDALVVGLNGDASVRALKGPGRPVNPAEDRGELLLALESVDGVAVFDGERATALIREIAPQVYAKGGDYTPETLNPEERAALDEVGAAIEILSLVEGKSTSGTLAKLRQGDGESRVRIGVLGSGKGSNFDAICVAIERGELDAEVGLVIADREGAGLLEKARERGVEAVVVGAGEAGMKEMRDRLRAAGVEVVALAGYMRMIGEPLLGEWAGRILNIHPSLLPRHRGARAWEKALAAGDRETGCTVHRVTAELDAGEVLAQERVEIVDGDTPEALHARIQAVEHVVYPRVIGEVVAEVLASRC